MYEAIFQRYQNYGLVPLLEQIRDPNRYKDINGYNVLTNTLFTSQYSEELVLDELQRAVDSRKTGAPFTSRLADTKQGLSLGLNPYTDWAIAQLDSSPSHWHIFVAADYYSIGQLEPESWYQLIQNPFALNDPFWVNLWSWILGYFDIDADHASQRNWSAWATEEAASRFIRASGQGFVFHNRIPYLRPPEIDSTDKKWLEAEWNRPDVRKQTQEDLLLLLKLLGHRVTLYCTNGDLKRELCASGVPQGQVVSFGAHPSKASFKPYNLLPRGIVFKTH